MTDPVNAAPTGAVITSDFVATPETPVHNLVDINPHHDTPPVPAKTVVPAVATAPDHELDSALTDLALAARVMGNVSTSIEVILDRLTTGRPDVEPASTSAPTVTTLVADDIVGDEVSTNTTKLSSREKTILATLKANIGKVVTRKQIQKVIGRNVDISPDIARIRKFGFIIESTQTMRKNGERVAKNLVGYRLSTRAQAAQRKRVTAARAEIKNFLLALVNEAFAS